MSNIIKLKRGSGSDPSASDLVVGEVALRTDSGTLFTKKDDGNITEIGAAAGVSDGDKGDITVSNSGSTFSIDSGVIDNANIASNAAIAGSKISPDFGSQNIQTTGNLTITNTYPSIFLVDSDNNDDFSIQNQNGTFAIKDETNTATRFYIESDGHANVVGRLDAEGGLNVTGNITVSGTVDGVDIAARNTLFGGLTSSSGVLSNGVTATTQAQSDNSNKVSTTAYVRAAVANLVNSAPSTLDTLKELSDALGADANFSTTVTNSIATKMPLAGGTFTGDIEFNGHARIVTGSINNSNTTKGLMFDGNYETGQYRTRIRKQDKSGGLPLYIDSSEGTANSYTAIARFGGYANNTQKFEVFGNTRIDGNLELGVYDQTGVRYLYLNGNSVNVRSTLHCTNGNLHIDCNAGNNTYLNYYTGSGTYFGGGATNVVAVMGADGDLWKGSSDNSGSKYWHAGGDGSGSGLDADTVDGLNSAQFLRSDAASTAQNDITFSGGAGAVTIASASDLSFTNGSNWSGNHTKIQHHSNYLYIVGGSSGIIFREGNVNRFLIDDNGHFRPNDDSTYDIGTNSFRVRNGYFDTLYGDGSNITALNASNLGSGTVPAARLGTASTSESGISAVGNFGQYQVHNTYQNFNTEPAYWGWNYVMGNANAPNTTSNQWYRCRLSLGSDYGKGSSSGDYSLEMAIPRYNHSSAGVLHIRTIENGSEGSWTTVGNNASLITTGTLPAARLSASDLLTKIKTVDGAGSGLDADTLDGVQGSSYLRSDAEDTITAPLNINGGTANASNDATLFVTATNNNDWGLIVNKNNSGSTEYGVDIRVGSSANYGLRVLGGGSDVFRVTGSGTVTAGGSNTVWHAGNDGSGSGLDADTVDGLQSVKLYREVSSAEATVGGGWITVAENTSGRKHGEIIVSDSDSNDHGFIRIDWMRSYNDSCFTVINCGGHNNRITGVRVLRDSDITYGNKKLQVYVTTSSTYRVQINQLQNQSGWAAHSVVTPVVQATISGYVTQGQVMESLDTYNFAAEDGIQAGAGGIKSNGSIILGANDYKFQDGNNARNMYFFSGDSVSGTDIGISGYNGAGEWRFQLYGASGNYGFLDANWNSWDIKKAPSGAFYVDEGGGLQRVWNQGNDGSGSGLDADTVDGLHSTSFVRNNNNNGHILQFGSGSNTGNTASSYAYAIFQEGGAWSHPYPDLRINYHTGIVLAANGSYGGIRFQRDYNDTTELFSVGNGDNHVRVANTLYIGGNTAFHAGNDGSGSGLDADTLDGTQANDMVRSGAQSSKSGWHINAYRNGNGTSPYIYFSHHGGYGQHINTYNTSDSVYNLELHNNSKQLFVVYNSGRCIHGGNVLPGASNSYDLGASGARWNNLYVNDMHFSNEGKTNDVDGSWGDWTLQEGENDIFMINNRSGKKFKIAMIPV